MRYSLLELASAVTQFYVRQSEIMRIATDKGIVIILVSAVVLFSSFYYFGPYSQLKHMELARTHAKKLAPLINADPRFTLITLGNYTGGGGMFSVTGFVAEETDMESLRTLVEESKPPLKTYWLVRVVGVEEFQRMNDRRKERTRVLQSPEPNTAVQANGI